MWRLGTAMVLNIIWVTSSGFIVGTGGILSQKVLPSLEQLAGKVVGLQLELCRKAAHTL